MTISTHHIFIWTLDPETLGLMVAIRMNCIPVFGRHIEALIQPLCVLTSNMRSGYGAVDASHELDTS